ncbi:hypothetical protein, partial [Bacteroides acidifaciens]|uniref:hypothetical protein n=1 Tax=Bacteroides acidifaciens TaxID=85831 RepID=UPI00259B3B78
NHYAISCIVLKISYVFNKQDEHNASYVTKMSWTDYACPTANLMIIYQFPAIMTSNLKIIAAMRRNPYPSVFCQLINSCVLPPLPLLPPLSRRQSAHNRA